MITGTTRVVGIIADPVAQVRTPQVMNAYFADHGVDAVVVPMHLPSEGLSSFLAAIRQLHNLAGLVVTVPHKTKVIDLCDEVYEQARLVGAANAIRRTQDGRLVCDMFDGQGFLGGLLANGIDPRGQRVLLLGAGGAASAIAFALASHGASALTIANRTQEKARVLAARVAAAFPACRATVGPANPAGFDMVVRICGSRMFNVRSSAGFASRSLSVSSSKPAAVTSSITVCLSIRCNVIASRQPEPSSAL